MNSFFETKKDSVIVKIEGLSKHFGDKCALNNVSLEVMQGQVFGLVGENGAGKTTLIHHILGSYTPEQGSVCVFGLDPVKQPMEVLGRIGYLSETRDLPQWMRIEQLLRYMSAFYPKWDMDYAYRLLEQFGLDAKQKIRSLSRGELARTGLLVALAHRPDFLVLDEPSSGLDPVARMDILSAVVRSVAEEGRTVLFSSHLLDEVERVADWVCMLHHGQVVFNDSMEQIKSRFYRIEVRTTGKDIDLDNIPGVILTDNLGHGYLVLYEGNIDSAKTQITQEGGEIINITTPSLEEVFVAFAKKQNKEMVV